MSEKPTLTNDAEGRNALEELAERFNDGGGLEQIMRGPEAPEPTKLELAEKAIAEGRSEEADELLRANFEELRSTPEAQARKAEREAAENVRRQNEALGRRVREAAAEEQRLEQLDEAVVQLASEWDSHIDGYEADGIEVISDDAMQRLTQLVQAGADYEQLIYQFGEDLIDPIVEGVQRAAEMRAQEEALRPLREQMEAQVEQNREAADYFQRMVDVKKGVDPDLAMTIFVADVEAEGIDSFESARALQDRIDMAFVLAEEIGRAEKEAEQATNFNKQVADMRGITADSRDAFGNVVTRSDGRPIREPVQPRINFRALGVPEDEDDARIMALRAYRRQEEAVNRRKSADLANEWQRVQQSASDAQRGAARRALEEEDDFRAAALKRFSR